MLGRLTDPVAGTFHALEHEPIVLFTTIVVVAMVAVVAVAILFMGWLGPLWRNWITTVDHKRIGIMYIVLSIIMLVRGFTDALLMRSHQALALGSETAGFLPPDHYDQIFSAHGTIMIFFMATPMLFGILNYVVPLQLGARDVAFPFANNLGFWITAAGAILINISFVMGNFGRGGWLMYPPFTALENSPDTGVDYYLWSLQLSGIATTMGAVNFVATIIKMRAPGMTMMKMPVFCWTALVANILILIIYPVLTVALAMLAGDRYLDMNFFTNTAGANPMVWINFVWIFGHPEVYVLVIPAFGIISEIVPTFSSKRLFGYASMVWAVLVILILSCLVWAHHFFTMGGGEIVNSFFGIATMIIAVPTGVKVFNWLFTMYKGRIRFEPPMLWAMGMMFTFVGGGLTGVLLAVVPADMQFHNSLFLVAHFHHTIIGGVVLSYLGGLAYWFPKAFGVKPNRKLGIASFWCWFVGFYFAFFPLYAVGLMGATRRMQHYTREDWAPFFWVAAVGALIILIGILCFVLQILIAIWYGYKHKGKLPVIHNDPWGDSRTLEWSISSPPPAYNFATIPIVQSDDAFWDMKQRGEKRKLKGFDKIHMPSNSSAGIIASAFLLAVGFALVWHIWWLAAVGLVGFSITIFAHSLNGDHHGYYISANEVQKIEDEFTSVLKAHGEKA
ncbi:cbb3-type cytochrome c oxidase subunit I [Bartonella tamiae]|uniref:cbb3-type cytochrome c oxidase subunit I n=1 Tax=Bartonella tamiae TaxID=373638 RepID=UPI00055227F4|nr:cbb3-type cytochrome c oxidase subunit I [Bartonella tamiae]